MIDIYPDAIQKPFPIPTEKGPNWYWAGPFNKTMIVLHVTQGATADGAINWMKHIHLSVQFVIDRDEDATIYQLTPISAGAWHASQVNKTSIGIEHVALTNGTLPVTPKQKAKSASLVRWLCDTCEIPLDRHHVYAHNEASPNDHHVLCCIPTLDPDEIVKLALDIPSIPS
jgi:N-acetyl-anhydromuramyl-L-alanine amidase AmpD